MRVRVRVVVESNQEVRFACFRHELKVKTLDQVRVRGWVWVGLG